MITAAGIVRVISIRRQIADGGSGDAGPVLAENRAAGFNESEFRQLNPAGRARIRDPGDFQTVAPESRRVREGENDFLHAAAKSLIGSRVQQGQIASPVHAVNSPVLGIAFRGVIGRGDGILIYYVSFLSRIDILNPAEIRAAIRHDQIKPFGGVDVVESLVLGFVWWILTPCGDDARVRHVSGNHELVLKRLKGTRGRLRVQSHRHEFIRLEIRGHLKNDRPAVAGNLRLPGVISA